MAFSHESSRSGKLQIGEAADIYKYPGAVERAVPAGESRQLTIGDLHANSMKFMYFLVKEGVVNMSKKDYDELAAIYQKDPNSFKPEKKLEQADIDEFKEILNRATVNITGATVRLIGDEVGDRGQNDYFILKIIEKLRDNQVPVKINLSNHGMEFIEAFENRHLVENEGKLVPARLQFQANSTINMQTCIDDKLIKIEEVERLYQKHYKPAVQLIDYSLSTDGKAITLYVHAPAGVELIEPLATKFEVDYKADTPKDLAATIEKINQKFAEEKNKDAISKLWPKTKLTNAVLKGDAKGNDLLNDPVLYAIWNRDLDSVNPGKGKEYSLPYPVDIVHGHHDKTMPGMTNLDSSLGKSLDLNSTEAVMKASKESEGQYLIEVSNERSLNKTERKEYGLPEEQPINIVHSYPETKPGIANLDSSLAKNVERHTTEARMKEGGLPEEQQPANAQTKPQKTLFDRAIDSWKAFLNFLQKPGSTLKKAVLETRSKTEVDLSEKQSAKRQATSTSATIYANLKEKNAKLNENPKLSTPKLSTVEQQAKTLSMKGEQQAKTLSIEGKKQAESINQNIKLIQDKITFIKGQSNLDQAVLVKKANILFEEIDSVTNRRKKENASFDEEDRKTLDTQLDNHVEILTKQTRELATATKASTSTAENTQALDNQDVQSNRFAMRK